MTDAQREMPICVYSRACVSVCACMCACMCVCECMHIYVWVHMCVCGCECMHVCLKVQAGIDGGKYLELVFQTITSCSYGNDLGHSEGLLEAFNCSSDLVRLSSSMEDYFRVVIPKCCPKLQKLLKFPLCSNFLLK